ncbi:MAG TPA: hypothetical protein VIT89_09435 [Solirubrobacterales bacterium]
MSATLCAALMIAVLIPLPEDAGGNTTLPTTALGQAGLYRLEVALLAFYGVLLLATPSFLGLARGRLPTEISVRGAKFEEKADQSAQMTEARIKELKVRTNDLADELAVATIEIDRLKKGDDNT